MKNYPAPLLAHLQGSAVAQSFGLRITRADAQVFAWTDRQADTTVNGTTFRAAPGADLAAIVGTSSFAVDNTEVKTVLDDQAVTEADIQAGRWDGARWELLRFVGRNVGLGFFIERTGSLGAIRMPSGGYALELRGDSQDLQANVGSFTTPTCQNELGDARCGVDLGPLTVTRSFTSVANRWQATDSSRTEAVDWFREAPLTITSGPNEGLVRKVIEFEAGQWTFGEALPFDLEPGDTYSVPAGCMRRFEEDCVAKHANARRFRGEPHLPGQDKLQRRPSAGAP